MKAIINPERLVSVPFNKTQCGVDFYINTGESKDICGVLTRQIFSASISFVVPMDICC